MQLFAWKSPAYLCLNKDDPKRILDGKTKIGYIIPHIMQVE